MEYNEYIKTISEHDGIEVIERQLIEELSELIQSLNKIWRKENNCLYKDIDKKILLDNLKEEIADVENCLDYVKYLRSKEDKNFITEIAEWKKFKLIRSINRIKGDKQHINPSNIHK